MTGNSSGPNLNGTDPGNPGVLINTLQSGGGSSDDDAIVEAANRIATEARIGSLVLPSSSLPQAQPVNSVSWSSPNPPGETTASTSQLDDILSAQLPPIPPGCTSSSEYPGVGQSSSTRHQVIAPDHPTVVCLPYALRCNVSHRIIQVTREVIVDIDQLRLDLREVFDEFLVRANAVVDRHIKRRS